AGIINIVSAEWATAAVKYNDNIFNERILHTDDGFFETFTFPLTTGTINLNTANQIAISEEYTQKYFGTTDPIGKTLTVIYPNGYKKELTVSGIIKIFQKNSSIRFDLVTSSQLLIDAGINDPEEWRFVTHALFLNLENPLSAGIIQSQLKQFLTPEITESSNPAYVDFLIEPLKDVSLNARKTRNNNLFQPFPDNNLMAMLVSGALILLVACFNYINTSLAFASKRFREIGVRKTLGSSRFNLVSQVMSENIIFCIIALLFAMGLTYFIAVPGYNGLTNGDAMLEFSPLKNIRLVLFLFALLIGTGVISGLYPAFVISKFNPIGMFRGKQKTTKINFIMRGLLVMQFSISLIAVIASVIFAQNTEYTKNFDLGYEKESVVTIPVGDGQSYNLFKNMIKNNSGIECISGSRNHILTGGRQILIKSTATEKEAFVFDVDFKYLETVKLRLKQGRSFDENIVTDADLSIVVSDEFIRLMGWQNAIGKPVTIDDHTYTVIGTIQNFWISGTFTDAEPALFKITPEENFTQMQILLNTNDIESTNASLKEAWEKLFPFRPYEGYFYNRALAAGLHLSDAIQKWATAVAFVAIIIAGMGLFSMVSLKIAGRTKEIGIRKVLGASASNMLTLLNKEFVIMLLVSILIGNFAGYFLMKILLDSVFVYHVAIGFFALLIADILILLVSIIT
ncbi:MAG: FtsX-like permease family protein, partial [bacterium]